MSRDVLMSPQRIYVQFSLQREKIIKWIIGLYLGAVRNWKLYTDVRYIYVFSEKFKHINVWGIDFKLMMIPNRDHVKNMNEI